MVAEVPPAAVLHVGLVLHLLGAAEDQRAGEQAVLDPPQGLLHLLPRPLRPALLLLVEAAVAGVQHPGRPRRQHLERLGDAGAGQVLQGPVPVVVVVGAELVVAAHQLVVHLPGQRQAHVVLGGHPAGGHQLAGQRGEPGARRLVVPQGQDVAVPGSWRPGTGPWPGSGGRGPAGRSCRPPGRRQSPGSPAAPLRAPTRSASSTTSGAWSG